MKVRIPIKPLSVNQCWQGRRFKTPLYKAYEQELSLRLPKIDIAPYKLRISVWLGVSSKNSDLDNPIKPFLDILSKKYGFNDKKVYRLEVEKVDVKKGDEFIEFQIQSWKKN